jgi:hypothetical protein
MYAHAFFVPVGSQRAGSVPLRRVALVALTAANTAVSAMSFIKRFRFAAFHDHAPDSHASLMDTTFATLFTEFRGVRHTVNRAGLNPAVRSDATRNVDKVDRELSPLAATTVCGVAVVARPIDMTSNAPLRDTRHFTLAPYLLRLSIYSVIAGTSISMKIHSPGHTSAAFTTSI